MRAYFCFTKQTRWTSHFFFFGSKYKETHVVDSQPPSPLRCKSWSSTKNTQDGKLIELTNSKTSFGTNNKVKIDYSWPTSKSGFVQNSYLNKGVIFYDFFKDSLSSPIIPLTNCHISTGYCATYTMTIVWDVSRFSTCPKTRRLGLQSLKLYYNHTSLYRVEIPSRGMSIHRWSLCPHRAVHCFSKKLFCTINGIYIVPFKCQNLQSLYQEKTILRLKKHLFSKNLSEVEYPFPHSDLFLNEIEDQLNEFALKLNEQNHLLHCQLERTLNILSSTLGKLYPSEILSLALGRPSLAISAGDVITQLTCQPINATVLPTLAFDNETKFSLLPLVEYGRTQYGKSRIGQLVSPNFVVQGKPSYYEHYHPGRTLIFQINSRFVLFENYSLSHSNLPVNQLHVPLTVITDTISVKDFADIHQAVTETHNGLTDLNSLIATIVQTAVDRDKLQQAIFSLQASEVYDANFSVVTNSVRHFARHTFLLALEELSTPFITIMVITMLKHCVSIFLFVRFEPDVHWYVNSSSEH